MSDLRFAPRGDRIAFFEHPTRWDDRGSVNVVDLQAHNVTLPGDYSSEQKLAWSRDGKEILFSALETAESDSVPMTTYAIALGGKRRVALAAPGEFVIHDVGADGRWLATREDFSQGIMVHTPELVGERDLSWLDFSSYPVLSKDARLFVFSEQATVVGSNYVMCLRRTDGGDVVRLGEGSVLDLSVDGKSVLALVPSTPPQLAIYPTGAGQSLRLDRGGVESYDQNGYWLPSGDSIVFQGREAGKASRYFVQRLSGGLPHAVTPEGTREGLLSADGAFVFAKGPDGRFYTYPIAGGAPRPMPGLTPTDRLFRASADGRSVLTRQGSTVPMLAERVDLESGRRVPFREFAPADRAGLIGLGLPTVSNDEQSYAYQVSWMRSKLFSVSWGSGTPIH